LESHDRIFEASSLPRRRKRVNLPTQNANKPSWRHYGHITVPAVDDYLFSLLPPRDEVLAEIEAEASTRKIPIVGPAVARVLYQLALLIGAKTVFEMGSAIGYSTIWWARAVGKGGKVYYTDGDRKNAAEARQYFERAGVADRIVVGVGEALELISEQKQEFDIVFSDIDKTDYPRAMRLALPKLRKGGLFITDNVLWSGRVADAQNQETSTKAIRELNQALYENSELFTTVLPIRDGLAVAVKR
jgi:predicted O-methyltransferase YrrM